MTPPKMRCHFLIRAFYRREVVYVSEEGTLPFFGMYGVFHELPRYRL